MTAPTILTSSFKVVAPRDATTDIAGSLDAVEASIVAIRVA